MFNLVTFANEKLILNIKNVFDLLHSKLVFFFFFFSLSFKVKAPSSDKATKILGVMYSQHTHSLCGKGPLNRRQRSLVLWDIQIQTEKTCPLLSTLSWKILGSWEDVIALPPACDIQLAQTDQRKGRFIYFFFWLARYVEASYYDNLINAAFENAFCCNNTTNNKKACSQASSIRWAGQGTDMALNCHTSSSPSARNSDEA